jgi:hypothetical protein
LRSARGGIGRRLHLAHFFFSVLLDGSLRFAPLVRAPGGNYRGYRDGAQNRNSNRGEKRLAV